VTGGDAYVLFEAPRAPICIVAIALLSP